MAHIYELAPEITHYTDGRKIGKGVKFPNSYAFKGMNEPSRIEGDIFDLEVSGTIPKDINGTFYRIQPDHRFPPIFEDDIHFNGDGSVTAIRIQDGHADFKQRYVQTDRYKHETAARKSLFGRYRNPFTDNETVKGVIRTASNTNITFWRGVLLASKEDGPPFAMDPVTLETIGRYDFEGQILAPTFTAHPKFDPETGEMLCFAYEAGGDGSDCSEDVVVWTLNADGVKTEEAWYKAPFAGMIHDCGVSTNWMVLPLTPLKASMERIKRGGNKFAWDPNEDQRYGLVPRNPSPEQDIIWFRAANGFQGHIAGCYENEEGHVVVDLTMADGNVFFWFPPDEEDAGQMTKRNQLTSPTCRWILDPKAETGTRITPADLWLTNGEFSRIDDRFVTKKYTHFWQAKVDPTRPYDFQKCGPPAGGLFNCLGHFSWNERKEDVYFAGPTATFQEPTFIPKDSGGEGEGYLIALLNHLDILRNDVVIFDAQKLAAGPLAVIHLPLHLKLGLHGNFVDHRDIVDWQRRRAAGGDIGPVKPAKNVLPWQREFIAQQNGNTNGVILDGH
ncbi:putative 9-cis-epoxycarotenoid dioxygenase [Phaeomoniella chlamydospora]|uniref:Putative 9-cis-epoxycarotenoid dioxygenase n=1 Tax=Phaeomoniella chlamydospora TaxID=158046 RepID=A0A0G2ET20_PHACM|nr:putative 9-cis-epoxycarotenoid dioxygenase [Phaeomoniella chlamydospora]